MELFNLRVVVDRIEGRPVCGLKVGDYFELTNSSELRIPPGKHFCMFAISANFRSFPRTGGSWQAMIGWKLIR